MNDSKISVRYARALFQSAIGENILERVNQDMILISGVCKIDEIIEFLKNPVIVPSKKSEIFHMILDGRVEGITLGLIDLMVKNGRESYLPAIARNFIHNTLHYRGITKSILTTSKKLDEHLKRRIIDLISGVFKTKVELEEITNPEIIGGFILRVDDNYIDASIRNKLNKIRKELIRGKITS